MHIWAAMHLVPNPFDPRTSGPPLPVPRDQIGWGPFVQGDQCYGDRLSSGTESGGPEVRGPNGFGTKCVAAPTIHKP